MKVCHLRTQHRKNPVGITELPEFSWRMESSRRNVKQESYRIVVKKENDEIVWDSEVINSGKQAFVPYEGKKLESACSYHLWVSVWDNYGESACTEGSFETGILNAYEWKGKWIESSTDRSSFAWFGYGELAMPVIFRKKVWIKKDGMRKARLYSTAHGVYQVQVGKDRVDCCEFAPEHTVYSRMQYVQTFDVMKWLKEGENELQFYVGDGWYHCPQTRQEIEGYEYNPALLFQLEMEYEDGNKTIVCTDGTEECATGEVVYSDLFLGEKQDARQKDREWLPAKVCPQTKRFSFDKLKGQIQDPVKVVACIEAKEIYRSAKGEWIVDFGQIICGRARTRIDAPVNTEIILEYFEQTDQDGNYKNTMIAPQKDIYVSDGRKVQYEAKFTYHGFRYIRVTGMEHPLREEFCAVVLSSERENKGNFCCSDWRMNRLYQNIRWSQTNNMLSIPTDCPSREKGGFTGDMQIYAKTALLNEEMTPFLNSWLENMTAAQADNGAIPITVPETAPYIRLMKENAREYGEEYPIGVAGWSDAAVLVPWMMYLVNGDERILEKQYSTMKGWCDYIISTAYQKRGDKALEVETDRYLWNTGFHFGEWLIPGKEFSTQREACEDSAFYVAPIFGYISTFLMEKIAAVLGKAEDEAYYHDYEKKMKRAIEKALIHREGENYFMETDNVGAYVMMLVWELVPQECQRSFAKKVEELVEAADCCVGTGFLATPYLLDALDKIGRSDLAVKVLFQTKQPSWLYEVGQGATAIWESWDAIGEDGMPKVTSFDHYAFGCVDEWICRRVAGLDSLKPGFRKIQIEPHPESFPLTWCERSFCSEYGEIKVHWDQSRLKVKIPCNTEAIIKWKGKEYSVGSGEYEY